MAVLPSRQIAIAFWIALAALPLLFHAAGETFYLSLMTRLALYGLAAAALNLILGFGGLVSLGHAAFIGIGAYSGAILAHHGFANFWLQLLAALGASAGFALLTGLIALRTRGAYFIMITLAFAQMAYFAAVGAYAYGGDDGLPIRTPPQLGLGLRLDTPITLHYLVLIFLGGFLFVMSRLRSARFGRALEAAKVNEARTETLGYDVIRIRLAAYAIAGMAASLAGLLLAHQAEFVSPSLMHWTRSGELIVMAVLGGLASVMGPVYGAFAFLLLEETLSSLTQHWAIILGPALIALALYARGGIAGLIAKLDEKP